MLSTELRLPSVAYSEDILYQSNVLRWYKMISESREDVNDTSTTDENSDSIEKIVLVNRRITLREVAEDLNKSIDFSPEGRVNQSFDTDSLPFFWHRQKSKKSQNPSKQNNCQKSTEHSKWPNLATQVRGISTNTIP